MRINTPTRKLFIAGFVALLALGWFATWLGNAVGTVVPFLIGLAMILVAIYLSFRLQEHRRMIDYWQLEAFITLVATLKPEFPLPSTREWAASPDLLKKVTEVVLRRSPKLVVEASSGASTIVTALALRRLGQGGKVVSLEHDEKYAQLTRQAIDLHGLGEYATVVHAPLKDYDVRGTRFKWYDISSLELDGPIEMLVVDGPPTLVQRMARYPAVPLLRDKLAEHATIIVDDGDRPDERHMVQEWSRVYGMDAEYLHLEKGGYIVGEKA
jgi:hypothetical protein